MFGGRKGHRPLPEPADWPQLPGATQPTLEQKLGMALPALDVVDVPSAEVSPEQELLDRIAGFRSAVADSLYELSKDYRILCDLTHADLKACDEIIEELRRRLVGNLHYAVLAKLDEAHALAAAHLVREA
jgi:hypothetical protein